MPFTLEQFWIFKLQAFIFYLTRIGALVMVAPVFSSPRLQARTKVGVVFVLTFVVFLASFHRPTPSLNWDWSLLVALLKEIGTGLLLGFTVAAIFSAFEMAGELIGLEMGLGIARVFNPNTNTQTQLLSNFLEMFAMLIFLSLDGHHWIVEGLVRSFQGIPPGTFPELEGSVDGLIRSFSRVIDIAARIAMPTLILLFIASVGIAILAKTVPQIHMLDMGYPLRILTGFAVMVLLLPYMLPIIRQLFWEARVALFTVANQAG